MSTITPNGYDVEQIDAPKYVSRGEFDLTGTEEVSGYMPLKISSTTLDSGAFGLTGIYRVRQLATVYNDISGMSGCIGVSIRKIRKSTDTGLRNQNIIRRKMAVLHEGTCYMRYESGTLDGTPVTLRYGDLIAPCTNGFRAYEDLNVNACSGMDGTQVQCLTTGDKQTVLGMYADIASNLTGSWKKVKIIPHNIYGRYP